MLYLLLLSLSGTALLFGGRLQDAREREWAEVAHPGGQLSFDASLGKMRVSYPGHEIRALVHGAPNKAIVYGLRKGEERLLVYVHPVTGIILYEEDESYAFPSLLSRMHTFLFAGTDGQILLLAAGLFSLVVLGFWALLNRGLLRNLFGGHAEEGKGRALPERVLLAFAAFLLLLPLLFLLTGLIGIGKGVATGKPVGESGYFPEADLSVDATLQALAKAPHRFRVSLLRMTGNSNTIELLGRSEPSSSLYGNCPDRLFLDGPTGRVLQKKVLSEQGLGQRIAGMAAAFHSGSSDHGAFRFLYLLSGLLPLLAILYLGLWGRRKEKPEALPPGKRA